MPSEAFANSRFYVEIAGVQHAVFTELSGLQMETEVEEYEEGGNNEFIHYLPGRTRIGRIILKRGVTKSNKLFEWFLEVSRGKFTPRNISVLIYNTQGYELLRWDFIDAYPVKWIGPHLTADGAVMAIETLELAHKGLANT